MIACEIFLSASDRNHANKPIVEDSVIVYDERVFVLPNKDGVPDAKLTVTGLKIKSDRGQYTCVATNELGTSNSTVVLKVKGQCTRDNSEAQW